ncbi:MAG: PIN domain-containing protein [Thermoplasmata archaeon]|nr:PIN domain-containing protein [Thermoplasmata archaeon]
MKGLDAPILLAILRGRPEVKALLRALHGEELATPELVMFELEAMARADPASGRERRLAALDKLRRRLTVLPFDEQSARVASTIVAGQRHRISTASALLIGVLDAHGCSEWITTAEFGFPKGVGRVKPRYLVVKASQ